LTLPVLALDRNRRIEQFSHTAWTAKEGEPGEVQALAQTTDGFLWLGTPTGLYRFDGVHFDHYQSRSGQQLPESGVISLLATPDGGIWIGFMGGGAGFLRDGRLTTYSEHDGLPHTNVFSFARDQRGGIWAAAGLGGLFYLNGSQWKKIGEDWNFSAIPLSTFVDHSGTLWVGTRHNVVSLRSGAKKFETVSDRLKDVYRMDESHNGVLWMAETGDSVRPVPTPRSGGSRRQPQVRVGSGSILFDSQGSLWIASLGDGIRRIPYPERLKSELVAEFSPAAEIFTQKQGLTGDYAECILQDREGNIWVGTNLGLDRFRQTALVPVNFPPGTSQFTMIPGDGGTLWAAAVNRLLMQIRDGQVVSQQPPRHIDSAYRSSDGTIWMATPRNLLRFDHGHFDRAIKAPGEHVQAITCDQSGRLWVSIAGKGVFRQDDSGWTSLESLAGPQGTALSAFTDATGRIWFGFENNVVVVLDGDKITRFSSKDGVLIGDVMSIQGRGSNIWIGGDAGLTLFDGTHFHLMIPKGGRTFRGVTGIVATAAHGIWISENRGIIQIPETEVQSLLRNPGRPVEYQVFDFLDGLPAQIQKSNVLPTAIEGTDGLPWFATTQGLVWVDPRRLPKNTLPPPVSIESLTANGTAYTTLTSLKLPPRTTNLLITYTAASLAIPERVRFRYKLEGLDTSWQDADHRREASYTNLGPGSYRFHVTASNEDGVWNETGASFDFSIVPAFYQTRWFVVVCGLAAVASLWSLYRLRLRNVTRQIRVRLTERLAERERIARELHDTLLQGVQGMILRFQAVAGEIPKDGPLHEQMENALQRADELMVEGRDSVMELRASLTTTDLAAAFTAVGKELSEHCTSSFTVLIDGAPRELQIIVRDEIYRIGREALTNASRHAEAKNIEVEIAYEKSVLRLSFRDDGIGIDPRYIEGGRPGHWGLTGMYERIRRIQGHMEIWSRRGSGTEIRISVPAPVAYLHSFPIRPFVSRLRRFLQGTT